MGHNRITELPTQIKALHHLTNLHVDNKRLAAIPDGLLGLPLCTTLDLTYNQISGLDDVAKSSFARWFLGADNTLRIAGNPFDHDTALFLAHLAPGPWLSRFKEIQEELKDHRVKNV